MRMYPIAMALGVMLFEASHADPAMRKQNSAVSDPQHVANPALSWVCLNPQTRQYQALKAASLQLAQRSVGGDDTTQCKAIPAALDPQGVAQELNTNGQP